MNLFNLHTDPSKLLNYNERFKLPELALKRLKRDYIQREKFLTNEQREQMLNTIATTAKTAFNWAHYTDKRFERGEDAIATHAGTAYAYAMDYIEGRWEQGEDIIATDGGKSFYYAENKIRGRWEQGEDAIKQVALNNNYDSTKDLVINYAVQVAHKRWDKEFEDWLLSTGYEGITEYKEYFGIK